MKKLGVYIHIPFCIKKCNYCDFCSFPNRGEQDFRDYTDELCRRIREFGRENGKRTADTVYFGGGTPTLLPTECFEDIMQALKEAFDIEADAEITTECNPASIDAQGLSELRKLGINRLSVGLQSANENELSLLGRVHDFEEFRQTFFDARRAGFDNIGVDLMYGIPDQTVDSFENTLREVCKLSPEHISAYGLKIEEGTVFGKNRGRLNLPDEDTEAEMYLLAQRVLGDNGYRRYEISNFTRCGYESRHNMRYWTLGDYIGFGVSAHSYFEGERFASSADLTAFLRGEDITEQRRRIFGRERAEEYLMLAMRLSEGVDIEEYVRIGGKPLDSARLSLLADSGYLRFGDGRIAFTTKGFFVSNAILCELLDTSVFE